MGVYLSQPQTKKNTTQLSGNGFKFCSSEMQGWRKNMEDADIHQLDLGDGNAIFGVFDGHGGHQVSKYVESIYIQVLKETQAYKDCKYQQALTESFKKIDQRILSEQGQKKILQLRGTEGQKANASTKTSGGVGCTANIVLITKQKYYVANIGDSRSALGRRGKQATQLSLDHKPQSEIQRERIQKAGGQVSMGRVNGGLNLSRSFGDFDYKQNSQLDYTKQMITCHPDVSEYQRSKQDEFIIIGCDGIWQKYVDNTDGLVSLVKSLLAKHSNNYKLAVQQLLDSLIAKQTKQGVGCDNMTAILIGFQ